MRNYKLATKRNITLIISVLFLVISFTFWGKAIIGFFIDQWSFIGGIVIPVAVILYSNKKVYLFIQRHLVLPFRVTHSYWTFLYSSTTQKSGAFSSTKKCLTDFFPDIKIITDVKNRFTFVVDDKITYDLGLAEESDGWRLTFKSSKDTVPSYEYEEKMDSIVKLVTTANSCSEPDSKPNFSITINFPDKNPYFGFLIQNLPKEYIKDFRVNISLPQGGSNITAGKDELTVNSTNPSDLEKLVVDYLTFSPNFAKV